MAAANLHTLDSDILYELLSFCSDLQSLQSLILTHRALYQAFDDRRRLILRSVFRSQNNINTCDRLSERVIATVNVFLLRVDSSNPTNSVAFHEALWPELERLLPSKVASKGASALLVSYRNAGLTENALAFARRTTTLILKAAQPARQEARPFVKDVIRTYMDANMFQEALDLKKTYLQCLDPRSSQHNIWGKQTVSMYRNTGHSKLVLQLQLEIWELYRTVLGPGNEVTLDWARSMVYEYQLNKKDQEAIQFHQDVWNLLDPSTVQYVAWSRQLIRMHKKQKQDAEALFVTEGV
ncbi:Nn.00g053090.m01.CDS01 [Neocucurbitaria sp. VM-36]